MKIDSPFAPRPKGLGAARIAIAASIALLGLASCDSDARREARVGSNLYEANCAACHGSHRGPAEDGEVLRAASGAPELRTLAQRWGSPLPEDRVTAMIDGRAHVAEGGPRPMPVWGDELYADWPESENREAARAGAISLLVGYLQSVQREGDSPLAAAEAE